MCKILFNNQDRTPAAEIYKSPKKAKANFMLEREKKQFK